MSIAHLTITDLSDGQIANAPAYASEVVPLALRSVCTATLQMSWSIGGILVAGVTYAYNQREDEWAWRMPLALQWIFPVSFQLSYSPFQPELTRVDSTDGPPILRSRISLVAHPQGSY